MPIANMEQRMTAFAPFRFKNEFLPRPSGVPAGPPHEFAPVHKAAIVTQKPAGDIPSRYAALFRDSRS